MFTLKTMKTVQYTILGGKPCTQYMEIIDEQLFIKYLEILKYPYLYIAHKSIVLENSFKLFKR